MDLASVVAALASVGVRVSGSTPNNNIQGDSSRACPTGLAGPEPSGTLNDPGQHFQPHIAPKGSSPDDMSCPSKGITLCQSLIGTQGKFLCNTNTCALHSKVILTHAISWPKSYNANSTLLTMIHYASAHVWRRKAYKAS